jgi:hypothetical protein
MYITQSSVRKAKNLDTGEKGVNVSELVVNHKSQQSHHGGTALVELDGTLLKLGLLILKEWHVKSMYH